MRLKASQLYLMCNLENSLAFVFLHALLSCATKFIAQITHPSPRWTNTKEAEYSSSTVIEIENPTGYVAYQPDLKRVIKAAQTSGTFPTLRDSIGGHGDTFAKKTVFFVDYVSFPSVIYKIILFTNLSMDTE